MKLEKKINCKGDLEKIKIIYHLFNRKLSLDVTILENSAISGIVKDTTITPEYLRRQANFSDCTPQDIVYE